MGRHGEAIKNQKDVLRHIVLAGERGLSSGELKAIMGVHRDTILEAGKALIEQKLVEKRGKFGNYRLTKYSFNDRHIKNWVFANETRSRIIGATLPLKSPYAKIDFDNFEEDYRVSSIIFEIANKVGALFVYAMLKALQRRNSLPPSVRYSGQKVDQLAREYIDEVIQPYAILSELRNTPLIRLGLFSPPPLDKDGSPTNSTWAFNELKEDHHNKLMKGFQDAYPEIAKELKNIEGEIPQKAKSYRRHIEKMEEKGKEK